MDVVEIQGPLYAPLTTTVLPGLNDARKNERSTLFTNKSIYKGAPAPFIKGHSLLSYDSFSFVLSYENPCKEALKEPLK